MYQRNIHILRPKDRRVLAMCLCACITLFAIPSAFSQIFTNNGATIHIMNGAIVYVNGSANNGSGEIDNDGTTTITNNFTIGAPATTRGLGFMYVAGDWTNNGTFIANSVDSSTIVWNGSGAQNYSGSSVSTFWNLSLTNGGAKMMNQDARLYGLLDLVNGRMFTSEANLFTFSTTGDWANGSTISHINGPASKEFPHTLDNNTVVDSFIYPIGKDSRYNKAGVFTQTFDSVTYRSEYFPWQYWNVTSVVPPLRGVSRAHYWHIDKIAGTTDSRVRLYWIPGDYLSTYINDPSTLVVARWNGAAWESEGGSGVGDYNSGYVTSDPWVTTWLTPNQPFTIGSITEDNPLPVKLSAYSVVQRGNEVHLAWRTEAEIENEGFEVERKLFNGEATLVKSYRFDPSLRGKSFWGADYSTTDEPEENGLYTYDLYQQDRNGIRTLIASKTVSYTRTNAAVERTLAVYPSPAVTSAKAIFTLSRESVTVVTIHDASGREVARVADAPMAEGSHEIQLPIDKLASGAYTLRVSNHSGIARTQFVIAK